MSKKISFENFNAKKCREIISTIPESVLNTELTVLQMHDMLVAREKEATEETERESKEISDRLAGKCFLFRYDRPKVLISIIRIDTATLENKYGWPSIKLTGKQITLSEGEVDIKELSEHTNWDQFEPNDLQKEISLNEFNGLLAKYQSIANKISLLGEASRTE